MIETVVGALIILTIIVLPWTIGKVVGKKHEKDFWALGMSWLFALGVLLALSFLVGSAFRGIL